MAHQTIHASPDFLNELDWQLRRLSLLIDLHEGIALSLGNLHASLSLLLGSVNKILEDSLWCHPRTRTS